MAFPEHQIAAPQLGSIDGGSDRGHLHVAIAWAGQTAGIEGLLHQTRTV